MSSRSLGLTALFVLPIFWSAKAESQDPVFLFSEELCREQGNEDSFCLYRPPPGPDVNEAVALASPTDLFSVSMALTEPVSLGRLRDLAIQLEIHRMLAQLEEVRSTVPSAFRGPLRLPRIGLGLLYERRQSWQREVCKTRIAALQMRSEDLDGIPPEDWSVIEIHVVGSAYAVRELMTGSQIAPGRLLDGSRQSQTVLEAFEMDVERNLAEPIANVVQGDWPPECDQFAPRIPVPILRATPGVSEEMPATDDFRGLVQNRLSGMAPETPVTLQLNFRSGLSLRELETFVSRHRIDGLTTSLGSPESGFFQDWAIELSIHGEPVTQQVSFQRCIKNLGAGNPSDLQEWRAFWLTVTLSAASVWDLLSDGRLTTARIDSSFAAADLDLVREYHELPHSQRDLYRFRADQCV